VLLEFLDRHPAVTTRCLYVDRVVDMLDEGFDVAVRIARLPDSALTAVKVGTVRRMICAAPSFLADHGVPQRPADLKGVPSINFSPGLTEQDWSFGPPPDVERIRPPVRMTVNTADVAITAAVAGGGMVRVLSYQVADELAAGQLVAVLEALEPPPVPIQLVHAEGRRTGARVRAFIDFAASALRARLATSPGSSAPAAARRGLWS
jgi:DNA-binding transcriptional LysR family regulator